MLHSDMYHVILLCYASPLRSTVVRMKASGQSTLLFAISLLSTVVVTPASHFLSFSLSFFLAFSVSLMQRSRNHTERSHILAICN